MFVLRLGYLPGLILPRAVLPAHLKMACSLLSEIHKDSNQWTICALVSRMWHYRGGTDEGPIKHTDLVLLDSEGTHMYGQIPPGPAERLKSVLREGKVYVIKKFLCTPSRPSFRPVKSPYMVQFTRYTVVAEKPGLEDTFPFCTYSLTAFADIPVPGYTPSSFIDVIGRITMVSDVIPVQSMHQTTASNTRTIMLADPRLSSLAMAQAAELLAMFSRLHPGLYLVMRSGTSKAATTKAGSKLVLCLTARTTSTAEARNEEFLMEAIEAKTSWATMEDWKLNTSILVKGMELMEKGSLETQLHGPSHGLAMSWHIRMKICALH